MSFWTDKKVLVTGGAGFIGSYLVEHLVRAGARVRVADNLASGRLQNLQAVQSEIEFMALDLRQLPNALLACEGQQLVFNLAAKITGIGYSQLHQAEMFETNMLLQQDVLHAAHACGSQKFCQVSSACVYPAEASVPTPESEGQQGFPEPANAGYGWAKRMGEILAATYAAETDMQVVVARPFNAYGPRDHFEAETSHVIPALIKRILDGDDPMVVWGSGEQTRVFLHASDFARALALLMECYDQPEPINIGHKAEISIRTLVETIQTLTGSQTRIIYDTTRPEGYRRRAADTTRLNQITGFQPLVSLAAGLAETVEWYRANEAHRNK